MSFCEECNKVTETRYLDCDEHGPECKEIICCECGGSMEEEE